MADKKAPGRPKRAPAPKRSESPKKFTLDSSETKDQNDAKIDQSTDKAKETNKQDLAGKEKVSDFPDISSEVLGEEKDNELERVKAELKKLKAEKSSKVVEVKIDAPKGVRIRPSQLKKQTHTVYVAKKRGDEWGAIQEREMSEPAYNAIAKDMSLKVTLPKNSRLVEPELKGCKDC